MDLYSSLVSGGTLFSLTKDVIAEPKKLFQVLDQFRNQRLGFDAIFRAILFDRTNLQRIDASSGK